MKFNAEELAKETIDQAVWILVLACIVIGLIAYCTQGVGSAIVKIAGALAIIFFLIALTDGKDIGQWLVDQLFTFGFIQPKGNLFGEIAHGIQLYTRI